MAAKLSVKYGWLLRYGGAVAAVAAGLLVRLGLERAVGAGLPTYITFYPAIMAVALLGGFGPGLVATLATALAVDYWVLPPHGFGVENLVDAVGVAFFLAMGLFMSLVAELYRRVRQRAAMFESHLPPWERRAEPPQPLGQRLLLTAGVVISLAVLAVAGWHAQRNMAAMVEADRLVTRIYVANEQIEHFLMALEEMEGSVRGFVVTGQEEDLRRYTTSLAQPARRLAALKAHTRGNPGQTERVIELEALLAAKLAMWKETIELRRTTGFEAAQALIATGKGRALTDQIRRQMDNAQKEEDRLLDERTEAKEASLHRARQSLLAGGLLGFLMLAAVFVFLWQENLGRRQAQAELRQHRDHLQDIVNARTAELARANESLRESEQFIKSVAEASPHWFYVFDLATMDLTYANRPILRDLGYPPDVHTTVTGLDAFRAFMPPEEMPHLARLIEEWRTLPDGLVRDDEYRLRHADGTLRYFAGREIVFARGSDGTVRRILGLLLDITDRIAAEAALRVSEGQLHGHVARLQAANQEIQASRRAALSLAEDTLVAHKQTEKVNADLQKAIESLAVSRRAALNLMNDALQARKEAEQASAELVKLNRTLKAHSKCDQALLRAQSEAEFLQDVCRIVVEDCGHAMVWVGFAEDDVGKTVRPVAQAGFEEGYLQTLNITWADTERGRGPTGAAVRTGQPCKCRNMLTDPAFAPWRAEALKRGYASSLVLPLLAEGRAFGALTIYSKQPDGFGEDEMNLLTELAGDLAYGITALRLRAAKARAEEAQRQSEERYRGLVELSPEALFVHRNDRIVLVNPAALQLFGASNAEQLLGKSPFELFHPDSHALVRERIGQVLAGQRVPVVEKKAVRLDGVAVDVEVVDAPVMDQGQRAIQVLLRDITERKRAQAALQRTTEDLRRSNRDLEQFAYVASHDLQEPLRAVGGYVKLLQHRFPDKLDAKARDYIAGAFDGAARMERLISDLLAFSRIGSRGAPLAPCDLNTVLDLVLRNLQVSIESTHAAITHDPLPTLTVDATQMLQLLQNLIGNALKFQGESPPRIHVGAQEQDGRWVFSVRDNGIGIEARYFDKLFQIFHRLHTRKTYSGTGIGLAICKKIVERHGGTIWVESQPGHGSTFYFSIPDQAAR